MNEILFSSAAARFFKKLKNKGLKKAFKTALLEVSKNPVIGEQKRGDLAGILCYDFKFKGVKYEIAYVIKENAEKKVIILLAGTRENFYEQLKPYTK